MKRSEFWSVIIRGALVGVLFVSCEVVSRDTSPGAEQPVADFAGNVAPGSDPRIDTTQTAGQTAPPAPEPVAVPLEYLLLPQHASPRVVAPRDSEIGELGTDSGSGFEAELIGFVVEVLNRLVNRESVAGLVRSDRQRIVDRRLRPVTEDGYAPERFRVGVPQHLSGSDPPEYRVAVRVFRDRMDVWGAIIVSRIDGMLRIVDVQLDLDALRTEQGP